MKYDVIIVGAGAAGLMAMRELAGSGLKVCLLEAAPDAGGRIKTVGNLGFSEPVELGAEFIHGKLPLTLALLKEANIPYIPVGGNMISVHGGEWLKENTPDEHWKEFMHTLKKQTTDITIHGFLEEHFSSPEYASLRESVQRFAEGFDLADTSKASILSIRNEWKHFDDPQFRVAGGYRRLVRFLYNACLLPDTVIQFDTFVETIKYGPDSVQVITRDGQHFSATKILVTASLGVLQKGLIRFDPPLTAHETAIHELGFGPVIKILLEFRSPFWKSQEKEIGFLLSDEIIPTWWTQLPAETNLLTGWIGGPGALSYSRLTDEKLLTLALESLAHIFSMTLESVRAELVLHEVVYWQDDPLFHGGYSYHTLQSEQAKKILAEPVYDTVYFAGEGMHTGESKGTVEAALENGKTVAARMISDFKARDKRKMIPAQE